ncbi:uncharacterized protein LOC142803198 [Rhipicephalus microplus]|uniref:uncharacterized protein LOC142803198 n=1 Tax=Rhipicephalus microplus TaxID=6941 RepID=UPI003F6C0EC0
MAGIKPPKPFDFQDAADWPAWMDEFDDYRFASGLHEKHEYVQVRTFFYTMGRKSREILRSLNVKDEEIEDFKLVKSKFSDYFVHTKNIVYESARFNLRRQQRGETLGQFATELSKLADRCEFAGVKERLIRDRFVVGLRDQVLSEELQMNPKLTMATALARARTSETVKPQQAELKEHECTVSEACVAAVKPKKAAAKSTFTRCQKPAYHQNNCSYCAGPFHQRNKCPAQKETCRFCRKLDHYEKACRKKKQRDPNLDSIAEADGKFIGTVEHLLNKDSDWFWGPLQETAFEKIKTTLSSDRCLARYNPRYSTIVSADASSLGALKYGSKTEVPRARSFVLLKDRDPAASKLKEKPYAETGVISSFSHTEEKQAPPTMPIKRGRYDVILLHSVAACSRDKRQDTRYFGFLYPVIKGVK